MIEFLRERVHEESFPSDDDGTAEAQNRHEAKFALW